MKAAVRDDVLASYTTAVEKFLLLVSNRKIDDAAVSFDQLYDQYGGKQTYLNYACFEFPRLSKIYNEMGDWKKTGDSLESTLLTVRGPEEQPFSGTANALWNLGGIKRFLLQNKEAVPLLEEAAELQARWPDPDFTVLSETIASLAKVALDDSNKPIASLDCWNTNRDGSLHRDKENIIDRTDWMG